MDPLWGPQYETWELKWRNHIRTIPKEMKPSVSERSVELRSIPDKYHGIITSDLRYLSDGSWDIKYLDMQISRKKHEENSRWYPAASAGHEYEDYEAQRTAMD